MSNSLVCFKCQRAYSAGKDLVSSSSRWGWFAAILLFVFAGSALAQLSGKGAITGTVTDSTGAVIPAASIVARNNASGITTTTASTGAGTYTFANLDPGIYTVTITAQGFEKLVQQNIHVNAMESQAYNPVLQVGAASTEVTVTAEPPQLETSNATLGATMENEMYSALPIEMGAYGKPTSAAPPTSSTSCPACRATTPTATPPPTPASSMAPAAAARSPTVYIDGIPFVRAGGNGDPRYVWTAISVDAVDQFQVQTSGYSAIYEGQGIQNYTIKQGGNQYHGSVYEFFRNTALDTWGFFGSRFPIRRPASRSSRSSTATSTASISAVR